MPFELQTVEFVSVKDNDVTGSSPRLLFMGDETIKNDLQALF